MIEASPQRLRLAVLFYLSIKQTNTIMSGFFTSIYKNVKVNHYPIVSYQVCHGNQCAGFLLGNKRSNADRSHRRNRCAAGRWLIQMLPISCQIWKAGGPQSPRENCKNLPETQIHSLFTVNPRLMLRSTGMRSP